jgi:anti-sigma regulatory factor (Ser/Thr protein kinase)
MSAAEHSLVVSTRSENVARCRAFVRDAALGLGASSNVVDRLQLTVSELATNAMEHGPEGDIEVCVTHTADDIALTVVSRALALDGPTLADVKGWRMASPGEITGRGLAIARAVMSDVQVDERDGYIAITCRCPRISLES